MRASETAIDLPLALAFISSFYNRPISLGIACFGEIGLSGEIRPVKNGEERIKEAIKQGFRLVVIPTQNLPKKINSKIELVPLDHVSQLKQFYEDNF